MALHGFTSWTRSAAGTPSAGPPRRRVSQAERQHVTTLGRPPAPSRRWASVRMAPATFLWLIGAWAAALVILAAVVLVLRSLA